MTSLELLQKVAETANEEKKKLTQSWMSADKTYLKQMLAKYPTAYHNGDMYETINNISARVAKSKDY
jgi:hypothetical protein